MQYALLPEPPDSLLVGMESVEVEMVEKESICLVLGSCEKCFCDWRLGGGVESFYT